MEQLAIIGSTASGKTALSIKLAKKLDGYILSLDSLAVYKEIDVASAKPTSEEMDGVPHFGLDLICPSEHFDVLLYTDLYKKIYKKATSDNRPLIIVGGSSFYLKILIDGISMLPDISEQSRMQAAETMKDISKAYMRLKSVDPKVVAKIEPTDRYRIEKMLLIWLETGEAPSIYFKKNPPLPAIKEKLPIYQIETGREKLRKNISIRTKNMLQDGLIDEVVLLERKYTRSPHCMKSIGIKETLGFLDGEYDMQTLKEKISVNTARLAKRQETFNRSQFKDKIIGSSEEIYSRIINSF